MILVLFVRCEFLGVYSMRYSHMLFDITDNQGRPLTNNKTFLQNKYQGRPLTINKTFLQNKYHTQTK